MLFNSYLFLFLFLPVTLAAHYLFASISPRLAAVWLCITSLVFYGWWNPQFVMLLVGSIAFNYAVSQVILSTSHRPRLQLAVAAASSRITALEESLGFRVFERSSRGVRLTRYGETLYENARLMQRLYDNTLAMIDDQRRGGGVFAERGNNRLDHLGAVQHAGLHGVGADVGKHNLDLLGNEGHDTAEGEGECQQAVRVAQDLADLLLLDLLAVVYGVILFAHGDTPW